MKLSDDVAVMNDIVDFTLSVLTFSELPVSVEARAELIFAAEQVLHQMIMDKIITNASNLSSPSVN